MTNTDLLRKKIEASGLKIVFIAEKVGISPQAFYKKLKDGSEWTFTQVKILKHLLNLKDDEVDDIFFTIKVE